MLPTLAFTSWLDTLRQHLTTQGHRCLVVLQGELSWSNSLISGLIDDTGKERCLAYGSQFTAAPRIKVDNYRHHLGTENDLVIFADADFHPDAFAALSGTIKAGGLMFWLCPPNLLEDKNNLFIQRLWQKITADPSTVVIKQQDKGLPALDSLKSDKEALAAVQFEDPDCCNSQQLDAVMAIEKVATGHRNRPLVLTADRGRGKSSALAIATANLLKSATEPHGLTILVTAPHSDALTVFFSQLQYSCPLGKQAGLNFSYQQHQVKFVAVDNLIQQESRAHLLLVDEAAGIPVYLLARMVEHYPRVVFSSTVHGYEGAGRGFSVKFKQVLAAKAPEFKQFHITVPVRWQPNDPLEQLVFRSFLLSGFHKRADIKEATEQGASFSTCQLSQQQLFGDETLLQQVFNVLVNAHYQTSPSDLKLLLNNGNLRIFTTFANQQCIGVVLAMVEGQVSASEVQQVAQSARRLKNHFLPQSLYLHANCQQAFELSYLRVMRIAVADEFQHQGIGLNLLAQVHEYGQQHGIDLLGTSFGANSLLLKFWRKANYQLVRLGFTRDKASGEHSALLFQPLSEQGQALFTQVQQGFYRQFSFLLNEQFQHLSYQLVTEVLFQCPNALVSEPMEFDYQVVQSFIERRSLYDNCVYSLYLLLLARLTLGQAKIPEASLDLLVSRILQKQTIPAVCQRLGFSGKKQLNQALISAVKLLV